MVEETHSRLELDPEHVGMVDIVIPTHFQFTKGSKSLQVPSVILEKSELFTTHSVDPPILFERQKNCWEFMGRPKLESINLVIKMANGAIAKPAKRLKDLRSRFFNIRLDKPLSL